MLDTSTLETWLCEAACIICGKQRAKEEAGVATPPPTILTIVQSNSSAELITEPFKLKQRY